MKLAYLTQILLGLILVNILACSPNEKLYPFVYDYKWGFINETGKEIIKPQYTINPLRLNEYDNSNQLYDSLYQLVDQPNHLSVNPKLYELNTYEFYNTKFSDYLLYNFTYNRAKVGKGGDYEFGFINPKGDIAIPLMYEDAYPFQNGLAAVKKNNKYGFIDTTGILIIPHKFDHVTFPGFNAEIVWVTQDSISGYIDQSGKLIWSCANKCNSIWDNDLGFDLVL